MPETRIGISGWRYVPWRGSFYPIGLPQRLELQYAAGLLNSIEINGSFYSLQRPSSFVAWRDQTPADFVFAVKGPRFITHMKKLSDVHTPLANFFATGVLALGAKLGPILWQLPPNLGYDSARLATFFDLLPRTTSAAALLAEGHDERLKDQSWTTTDAERRVRHALEVRHSTYETPGFIELLREHDIALVVADTAGKWPFLEDMTSDFVYVRLHGSEELYVSGYDEPALDVWAEKIRCWRDGKLPQDARLGAAPIADGMPRDVYVYFDNDVKVRAPFDAMSLSTKLGVRVGTAADPFNDGSAL